MKAHTVNFERGQDPKVAMDIGGVNFNEELNKMLNDWGNSLQSLVGKTIIVKAMRVGVSDGNGRDRVFPTVAQKITVKEIDKPFLLSGRQDGMSLYLHTYINDIKGRRFRIELSQNIHII